MKLNQHKKKSVITMNKQHTNTIRNTKTYTMAVTALMTAVTCIVAPLSIPIGPVPISLTNFAIYLSLYVLNWKKGTINYLLHRRSENNWI